MRRLTRRSSRATEGSVPVELSEVEIVPADRTAIVEPIFRGLVGAL